MDSRAHAKMIVRDGRRRCGFHRFHLWPANFSKHLPPNRTGFRQNVIPGLKDSIIRDLQAMLHRENSYVRALITSHEILSEEYKIVINADQRPIGEHSRIFNAPDCNEIAVLMVGEEHGKRDIVLRYRDERLQRIAETHRSYDPLQYLPVEKTDTALITKQQLEGKSPP